MTQNRRYLIIALIIMVVIMLWVSRGHEPQVPPTALPVNGMVEESASEEAAMPSEPAMDAPAPADDMMMPSENAAEVDGVPAGAEVSGAPAAEATTDMPSPEAEAPAMPAMEGAAPEAAPAAPETELPANGQ